MGMYDRDWYREDYRRREQEYGGDFSINSKKVVPHRRKATGMNSFTALFCPLFAYVSVQAGIALEGNPIPTVISSLLSIILFVMAVRRRQSYDKGILNALAMTLAILSAAYSIVPSFFFIYISVSKGENPFLLSEGWIEKLKTIRIYNPLKQS